MVCTILQDATFTAEDDSVCIIRNRLVNGSRNSQVSLSSNPDSDFRLEFNRIPQKYLESKNILSLKTALFVFDDWLLTGLRNLDQIIFKFPC